MILIVDNTTRKFRREAREALLSKSIPCALSNLERVDEYFPASLCAVTEKYIYSDTVYLSQMHERTPVIILEESDDFADVLRGKFDEIWSEILVKAKGKNISISERGLVWFGKNISLTKSEKLIVKMLMCNSGYARWDRIVPYCLTDTKATKESIVSFISSINKKTMAAVGMKIIESRRYEGYSINI